MNSLLFLDFIKFFDNLMKSKINNSFRRKKEGNMVSYANLEFLYQVLLSNKPSLLIKETEDVIFEMVPELQNCKGFNQNNEWHIYDVYEHILHVIDEVSPNINMRLAALFHDIGKPSVYIEDGQGVGHFHGHWKKL